MNTNGLADKYGSKLLSEKDVKQGDLNMKVNTITYKNLKFSGEYLPDDFFSKHFDLMRTGKIYGSRIFKSKALCRYEQKDGNTILGNDNSDGEYLADSIGLRCQAYVKGLQEAIDDFTDTVPMFKKWRCNAFLDKNGDIRIKYVQGQEGYKRKYADGETAMDDCILKMSFYWKMEEGESYFDYFVSDTKHDDTWLPWGDCIRSDKSVAPYFALPAYYSTLHKDEDGFKRLYSITNSFQQGEFSHERQLPYYSQANAEDESLLDDNTYSYEVGRGNGNETPGKNNKYRGRGRYYGTRHNITAYLALMQIIKYRTRNLSASQRNIQFNVPSGFDDNGNPKTGTSVVQINPWKGKINNNRARKACSVYLGRRVWWNDEAKDADGNYTIKRKRDSYKEIRVDIPESYFGEDFNGTAAFVPICPTITLEERANNDVLDEDGYPTVQIIAIRSQLNEIRVGNTYFLSCGYCNSPSDTYVRYNYGFLDSAAKKETINNNQTENRAKISKIEKIKVDLPEIPGHYDAFEVTKYDGTKMTIPEGELVVPADTYYFYKVYFEGIDSIQSINRDVRYNDNDPSLIHPTLKGKLVINDTIPYSGKVDMIPDLYDGSSMSVEGNKDIHCYFIEHHLINNTIKYYYQEALNNFNPYRLEGIEMFIGKWLAPSNAFVRGVSSKDVDGNFTDLRFEIYVAKKGAKRHKLYNTSGSFVGVDNSTDRIEDIEKNYNRVNLDPTSLLYVNSSGNFLLADYAWVSDCKIYQDEEGNDILYPIMRANGMYYPGSGNNEGQNWGDHIWGVPDNPPNGSTRFTYREFLLIGDPSNGGTFGISCAGLWHGLGYGYWLYASRPW